MKPECATIIETVRIDLNVIHATVNSDGALSDHPFIFQMNRSNYAGHAIAHEPRFISIEVALIETVLENRTFACNPETFNEALMIEGANGVNRIEIGGIVSGQIWIITEIEMDDLNITLSLQCFVIHQVCVHVMKWRIWVSGRIEASTFNGHAIENHFHKAR